MKPKRPGLRFHEKALAVPEEHDPCMPDAVTSVSPEDDASVESHCEELTPGPERKVLTVTRFALFEFLRRLPCQ